MHCDLHTHSIFSDGTFSPAQIIAQAKAQELVVALTDHNTVAGLPDFMAEAEMQGVTAVAGVELSTAHKGKELHLLGLFIPPHQYSRVEGLVKAFHVQKQISNMEMVDRLRAAGYLIDYKDVKKRNPTGNANRAHVAAELMEKGYVPSVAQAFQTLLGEEQGFYVPPVRLQLLDAIAFLRQIGALPILAHPLQDLNETQFRNVLQDAIPAGLLGFETYHSSYDGATIALARQLAAEYRMHQSGGSDFHGATKPNVQLGVGNGNLSIPIEVYHALARLHARL